MYKITTFSVSLSCFTHLKGTFVYSFTVLFTNSTRVCLSEYDSQLKIPNLGAAPNFIRSLRETCQFPVCLQYLHSLTSYRAKSWEKST